MASSSSNPHGIPADPPVPLDERISGPCSLTLEELMVSERLTYADAVVVFENVREGLRDQEAACSESQASQPQGPEGEGG